MDEDINELTVQEWKRRIANRKRTTKETSARGKTHTLFGTKKRKRTFPPCNIVICNMISAKGQL